MTREGPSKEVARRLEGLAADVPVIGLLVDRAKMSCAGAEAQWPLDDRRPLSPTAYGSDPPEPACRRIGCRRWTRAAHRVPDWSTDATGIVDCVLDQMVRGLVAALEEIGGVATLVESPCHKYAARLPLLRRGLTTYGGQHNHLVPWRLCHDYPGAWETPGGALGVADRLVRPDVLLMPPSGAEHPWVRWAEPIGVTAIRSSHVRPNTGFLFPRAELEVRCLGERMVSFERDAGARWAECYYAMVFRNPEKVATLVPMNPLQQLVSREDKV